VRGTDPRTFGELVSLGNVGGAIPWSKTGYNGDVGITSEDVWTYGNVYPWLAAATNMEVISTGAGAGNDVIAGSGAQKVQIRYLDINLVEQSEIVTMTGGVAAACANPMYRIQAFRCYQVGGGGAASGTINLRTVAGATVESQIAATYTRARNSSWTVPAGRRLYIYSMGVSSGSAVPNKSVLMTLRATYDDFATRLLGPNFFMPYAEIELMDNSFVTKFNIPIGFPASVDIKMSAISDSAGAVCTSILRGVLVTA
jgi:hypothetical protein